MRGYLRPIFRLHPRVHWEVMRLDCELLALAELHEPVTVASARRSGLFHLLQAASLGLPLAVVTLARVFLGLKPSSQLTAHLTDACLEHGGCVV